jgi:hypothetical protein
LKVQETEEVQWVAWSTNGDSKSEWQSAMTPNKARKDNKLSTKPYTLKLAAISKERPSFFTAMQTTNGMNPCSMRYKSLNNKQAIVFIEEETSKDKEVEHLIEVIGYITLWGDDITYDDLASARTMISNTTVCKGMKNYQSLCPKIIGTYDKTILNSKEFKYPGACTALVLTKGKTCNEYCKTQGLVCFYGQDQKGNSCQLDSNHKRQTMSQRGCL